MKIFRFSRHLRKEKYDIVQTFFQDATFFGVVAARMAGTNKIIVSVRDMGFWANLLTSILHRTAMLIANAVLVNSLAVKKSLSKKYYLARIKVIRNGILLHSSFLVNLESKRALAKELKIDEKVPIVVIVANCNRQVKRIDLVLESAAIVLKKAPAMFLIVGDGHLKNKLVLRSKELGVSYAVKFLGQRYDVDKILAGADIALNTSDSEGLSNSIMEAMRAGLPVIASNVEGNKELVKNGFTGLLFQPGDFKELAAKIYLLLNEKQYARKIAIEGRKFIELKFGVDKMVKKYAEFYEYLLVSKKSSVLDSEN